MVIHEKIQKKWNMNRWCSGQTYETLYGTHSWGSFEHVAHQETDPAAAAQCTFSHMKPNVTGETLICEHDIGISRNGSEREIEENDVKSATSEV